MSPVNKMRQATEIICDFCSGPNPVVAYPSKDFTTTDSDGQEQGMHGGWAACSACARLVDAGDYGGLTKRAAKRAARKYPGTTAKQHVPVLRKHFARFRDSREGDPVKIEPGDPHDPTRKDDFGLFMRMDGQQLQIEHFRPEQAQEDGRTLSEEAMSRLIGQLGAWVGTRMLRAAEEGRPPQKVNVAIDVALDGAGHSIERTPEMERLVMGAWLDGYKAREAGAAPEGFDAERLIRELMGASVIEPLSGEHRRRAAE